METGDEAVGFLLAAAGTFEVNRVERLMIFFRAVRMMEGSMKHSDGLK